MFSKHRKGINRRAVYVILCRYDNVRLLAELSPSMLIAVVDSGGKAGIDSEKPQPATITFFAIELLDTVARCRSDASASVHVPSTVGETDTGTLTR